MKRFLTLLIALAVAISANASSFEVSSSEKGSVKPKSTARADKRASLSATILPRLRCARAPFWARTPRLCTSTDTPAQRGAKKEARRMRFSLDFFHNRCYNEGRM
jgi:hypothetical protein